MCQFWQIQQVKSHNEEWRRQGDDRTWVWKMQNAKFKCKWTWQNWEGEKLAPYIFTFTPWYFCLKIYMDLTSSKREPFCKGLSSWLLNISVCWCCLRNFENFPRQNFPEVWSTPGQKGSWSKDNKLSSQGHLLTTIIISFRFLATS